MPKLLKLNAQEESTYIISLSFKDQEEENVVPTLITWTLTDADGDVINSREDISVLDLGSTVNIILSGDDLVAGTGSLQRNITVNATYNSLGEIGLPIKGSVDFYIEKL